MNNTTTKAERYSIYILYAIFAFTLFHSLAVVFTGFSHPIIDSYGFRQAQTAISSYYFVQEGMKLDYITPVLGMPWSIPFEFPLYQYITALVYKFSFFSLDEAGRFVNIIFYYLAAFSLYRISHSLGFSKHQSVIPTSLFLASPFYLFWSRTFMIESVALSLALLSFSFYLEKKNKTYFYLSLVVLLAVLSALTKVTTYSVAFVFIGLLLFSMFLERFKSSRSDAIRFALKKFLFFVVLPLGITILWTHYADSLKSQNPLANFILSSNLNQWNFGTLEKKLSLDTWLRFFERTDLILASTGLLFVGMISFISRNTLRIAIISLAAFIAGPLVFTNLYFVHEYYFYAAGIFAVFFVATGIVALEEKRFHKTSVLFTSIVICVMVIQYHRHYPQIVNSSQHNQFVKIGETTKSLTQNDDVLLIYGLDWDSSVPYYAERKALMDRANRPLTNPDIQFSLQQIGKDKIGAVLFCRKSKNLASDFVNERIKFFDLSPSPLNVGSCSIYYKNNNPKMRFISEFINATTAPHNPQMTTYKNDMIAFTHMPAQTDMAINDYFPTTISFGFMDGAWEGEHKVGGACFSIRLKEDGTLLHKQCLQPTDKVQDRGVHNFTLKENHYYLNKQLIFEITPIKNNSWGWTFWKF